MGAVSAPPRMGKQEGFVSTLMEVMLWPDGCARDLALAPQCICLVFPLLLSDDPSSAEIWKICKCSAHLASVSSRGQCACVSWFLRYLLLHLSFGDVK